jgi:hypothetical protein
LSDTSASFATTRNSLPPMLPTMYVGTRYSGGGAGAASTFSVFDSTICRT